MTGAQSAFPLSTAVFILSSGKLWRSWPRATHTHVGQSALVWSAVCGWSHQPKCRWVTQSSAKGPLQKRCWAMSYAGIIQLKLNFASNGLHSIRWGSDPSLTRLRLWWQDLVNPAHFSYFNHLFLYKSMDMSSRQPPNCFLWVIPRVKLDCANIYEKISPTGRYAWLK